ncbi:hypothetical protein BN1708_019971, partial [Verticillium longisporum]
SSQTRSSSRRRRPTTASSSSATLGPRSPTSSRITRRTCSTRSWPCSATTRSSRRPAARAASRSASRRR